jgi:hypothetical protein
MEPLTFLALFATCTICAFIAGYLIGNLKATCQAEQTRRWWMNRQMRLPSYPVFRSVATRRS